MLGLIGVCGWTRVGLAIGLIVLLISRGLIVRLSMLLSRLYVFWTPRTVLTVGIRIVSGVRNLVSKTMIVASALADNLLCTIRVVLVMTISDAAVATVSMGITVTKVYSWAILRARWCLIEVQHWANVMLLSLAVPNALTTWKVTLSLAVAIVVLWVRCRCILECSWLTCYTRVMSRVGLIRVSVVRTGEQIVTRIRQKVSASRVSRVMVMWSERILVNRLARLIWHVSAAVLCRVQNYVGTCSMR